MDSCFADKDRLREVVTENWLLRAAIDEERSKRVGAVSTFRVEELESELEELRARRVAEKVEFDSLT